MKPFEIESKSAYPVEHGGNFLSIDAKLFCAATHLHARRFKFEIRVDTNRHFRANAEAIGEAGDAFHFLGGFHVQHDTGSNGAGKLIITLARPGKADVLRGYWRIKRNFHLTRR